MPFLPFDALFLFFISVSTVSRLSLNILVRPDILKSLAPTPSASPISCLRNANNDNVPIVASAVPVPSNKSEISFIAFLTPATKVILPSSSVNPALILSMVCPIFLKDSPNALNDFTIFSKPSARKGITVSVIFLKRSLLKNFCNPNKNATNAPVFIALNNPSKPPWTFALSPSPILVKPDANLESLPKNLSK